MNGLYEGNKLSNKLAKEIQIRTQRLKLEGFVKTFCADSAPVDMRIDVVT